MYCGVLGLWWLSGNIFFHISYVIKAFKFAGPIIRMPVLCGSKVVHKVHWELFSINVDCCCSVNPFYCLKSFSVKPINIHLLLQSYNRHLFCIFFICLLLTNINQINSISIFFPHNFNRTKIYTEAIYKFTALQKKCTHICVVWYRVII